MKTLSLTLGAGAILGMAYLLFVAVEKVRPTVTRLESRAAPERPADVFRMNGLSYTAQDGGTIRVRLTADSVEVSKRRFGMLYVTPLKEAVLSNVLLELYAVQDEDGPEDPLSMDMLGRLLPSASFRELGIITRVRIEGLNVKRIRGQTVSSITAQRATIDPRTRVAELTGGVLVAGTNGRSIRSESATWDPGAGVLTIDGPYLFIKEAGQTVHGSGARFDVDLRGVRS